MAHFHLAILDVVEKSQLLKGADHLLAGIEAIEPLTGTGIFIESAIGIEQVDGGDTIFVALPDIVVVRVMSGGDLDATRSQFRFCPLVGNDRNLAVMNRQSQTAAIRSHRRQLLQAWQNIGDPLLQPFYLCSTLLPILVGRI